MEHIVGMISACILELQAAGYVQTAEILAIARLDLLACLHGVSEEELDFLLSAPQNTTEACPHKAPATARPAKPANKKSRRKTSAQNKSG